MQFQYDMDCAILILFLYLACFLVKYICDIYLSMLDFNSFSSTRYLLTRLQKKFNSCEPKEE